MDCPFQVWQRQRSQLSAPNHEQFGCSELFTHFPVILQLMKTDTETNVFSLQIGVESDIILIDTRPDYMLEFT